MVSQNPFIQVELYILTTFNDLIKKLTIRREKLLEEIGRLKSRYEKERDRRDELKRVEEGIVAMEKVKTPIPRESVKCLHKKLDYLQQPILPPIPQIECSKIEKLEDFDKLFLEYKLQPKHTVGKKGTGGLEFNGPRGIATDEKGNLYVAEMRNKRIQVLSSDCEYLNQFGKEHLLSPHSVVIHRNCAIVTDRIAHVVVKFSLSNYKLDAKCDLGFDSPLGLDVDNDTVYVANSMKRSIAVLYLDLDNIVMAISHSKLEEPVDVKVNQNNVFVAEKQGGKVFIFSKSGKLNNTLLALTVGIDFLCFGTNGNMIICDTQNKRITIFTAEWDYSFHIETDYKPTGVAVKSDGTILCSDKTNNMIQMY